MSYHELWPVLAAWRREFSAAEFAATFASPDPRKVLHDMAKKGLLTRVDRGRYRVVLVEDYARTKNNVEAGYRMLAEAGLPYALTGPDGVFVWTRGGYNAGRFFGFYPIHLKVATDDLLSWRRFFSRKGRESVAAGSRPEKTIFGVFYVLYPSRRVIAENRDGLMVAPLRETLDFCRENLYTFGPALAMLPRTRPPSRA